MSRRSFILTRAASRDIEQILQYVLENSGAGPALHVHDRLQDAFFKLATQPSLGHLRSDLADESLRVWVVFSYLIIYRPDTDPLQIIRVIHGARDIPSVMGECE